jgi:hypothetical protein
VRKCPEEIPKVSLGKSRNLHYLLDFETYESTSFALSYFEKYLRPKFRIIEEEQKEGEEKKRIENLKILENIFTYQQIK